MFLIKLTVNRLVEFVVSITVTYSLVTQDDLA